SVNSVNNIKPREVARESGASLTLIDGKQEPQKPKPAAANRTFTLDYESERKNRSIKKDYTNEDLDIPAFLRRMSE
ncbi:MAG TPA: hypothetical protein PLY36_09980, partial [Spirochaetota bacterium]|nr:hypothetical protein [Spirochaetota bacterium]